MSAKRFAKSSRFSKSYCFENQCIRFIKPACPAIPNLKSRRDLTIIAADEIGGKIEYNTNHGVVEPAFLRSAGRSTWLRS